jgi:formylglycine-generating enzyme required for sulfatase activity
MGKIAIDFGMARTKVAYIPRDGRRPELLRFVNEDGAERSFVPSLFYLPRDGASPLLGDEAESMLEEDPAGVIDDLKRRLRDPKLRANGRDQTPEALLTLLFSDLRERIRTLIPAFEAAPERLILTVPPSFGPAQRDILKRAGLAAGFAVVAEPIDEPVAAARGWLAEAGQSIDRLVVVNCGGGTVDWTYLARSDAGDFHLVPACPPTGIERLGGLDVDDALVALIEQKLADLGTESLDFGGRRRVRLRARLRRLKELNSRKEEERVVRIDGEIVTLTPTEMREVIHSHFATRVADGLRAYFAQIQSCGEGKEPPAVLLVGGSGRLRGVKEAIESLGCRILRWDRSDFAAVLGALAEVRPDSTEERVGYQPTQGEDITNSANVVSASATGRIASNTLSPGARFRDIDEVWCPEMVVIPSGEFWMGPHASEVGLITSEISPCRLDMPYRFAIGTCVVSFAEWDAFAEDTKSQHPDSQWGRGDRPVVNVTRFDILTYLNWLNRKLRLVGHKDCYRLPTEEEWEYAARGGTDTPFLYGWTINTDQANYDGRNSSNIHPNDLYNRADQQSNCLFRQMTIDVRGFEPNSFGLYQVLGNVWEMTSGGWMKGGSWKSLASGLRLASRTPIIDSNRDNEVGFRIARTLER